MAKSKVKIYQKTSSDAMTQFLFSSTASIIDMDGFVKYTDQQIAGTIPDLSDATNVSDAIKYLDGNTRKALNSKLSASSITTGSTNGTIAVNGTDVSVYGLSSGAYAAAYVHPTTAGNKHIPSGGSAGEILRWSANGTAVWGADSTYSDFLPSGSTAAHGLVPKPPTTEGDTKYLREDGTWSVPPDTKYTHPTTSGNKHIPSGGSSGQVLKYSADGTAAWATLSASDIGAAPADINTGVMSVTASSTNGKVSVDGTDVTVYTHPTTAGNKHIPSGGSSGQILKYSADGTATWANEYSYTHPTSAGNKHIPTGGSTGQVLKYGGSSGTASWATLTASDVGAAPSDIDTGVMSVTTGTDNGTISVDGTDVAVKGLASGAYAAAYSHPTSAGNKHIPSGGSAGKVLLYGGSSGTASWGNLTASDVGAAPSDIDTGVMSVTEGSTNGTVSVNGTDVVVHGLASGAYAAAYVHPTTAGNKHIPSGGSSGQILKYSADGTATWANEYSYTHPTTAGNKHIPTGGTTGQVLKYGGSSGTASWGTLSASDVGAAPSDINTGVMSVTASSTNGKVSVDGTDVTVYTHPTSAGNKHIPSGGSSGQVLKYSSAGTASWATLTASDVGALASGGTAAKATADASGNVITTTYATKSEVSAIPKFAIEVVEALPTTDISSTTVYLVATGSESQNLYTEYIYVNSAWEKLGTQTIDLSGYVEKSDIKTGSANGTISVDGTDVAVKGLASGAYAAAYTHPTSAGNKHIPSGGSSGQILKYSASGTAVWADEYSYTHPTTAGNKHIPTGGSTGQVLKYGGSSGTASWATLTASDVGAAPSDIDTGVMSVATGSTNGTLSVDGTDVAVKGLASGAYAAAYSHPTSSGNKHIPSGGSSGQILKWSSDGTATWAAEYSYTHPTTAGNKHIPSGGSSGQILKYSASGTAVWATLTASDVGAAPSTIDTGVMAVTEGETNGTISVDGTDVAVHGLASGAYATAYTHPTGAGYNHIPSGGSSGQILKYSAAGTATWANEYSYTHPTSAGNKHIPTGGSTGQVLKYGGSSGTASWATLTASDVGALASGGTAAKATADASGNTITTTYATKTEMNAINKNTSRSVEYIIGTQTAATNAFTGVTEDSSLYDGKCINYYLPYAGTSSGDTLNLTLADGTTTGAKNIYLQGTSKLTTHFAAGQVFMMTYSATKDAWYCGNYDSNSNTYDRTLHNNNVKAAAAITAGTVIVGTSAGYKMAASGVTFDITYPILHASAAIAASGTNKATYDIMPGVNLATTKSGWTGTQYATVYLVGTLSGVTFTIDSAVFTTTAPSSADGKVYIPIGVMDTTTLVFFNPSKTMYQYTNGSFHELDMTTAATGGSNGTIKINGTDVAVKGLASGAYAAAYSHPTSAGNKHIPAGGSSGQILKYSADGTAVWAAEYSYTHPTTAGNKHIPSGGSTGQVLKYGGSSGTASWATLTASDVGAAPSDIDTGVMSVATGSTNGTLSVDGTDVAVKGLASGAYATAYSHPNSGATAGNYGPSANASPAHGAGFSVPYITINAQGHVTAASTKTITLPAQYTHPSDGGNTGSFGPSANASPAHGAGFSVPYITVNAAGHVTAASTKTIMLPAQYTHPTGAGNNHIPSGGSSGQFLKWSSAGTATWAADNDTKNTAGSTDTSSKIFLIGATSQAANPQTYSDNEVYVTSGVLTTKSVQIGGTACTLEYNATNKSVDFVFA